MELEEVYSYIFPDPGEGCLVTEPGQIWFTFSCAVHPLECGSLEWNTKLKTKQEQTTELGFQPGPLQEKFLGPIFPHSDGFALCLVILKCKTT